MPAAARLLAGATLVGVALACVPEFACQDDAQCDAAPGGQCVMNGCVYPDPGSDAGQTVTAVTTGDAEATAADTDAPAACDPFDVLVDDLDKVTGLALAPDGSLFVVGVSGEPYALRLRHLDARGEQDLWAPVVIAATGAGSADDDTDIWARVALADDVLTVVHSQRAQDTNDQDGVYVRRYAASDGGDLGVATSLVAADRSLRAAVARGADSLLVAGETQENVWYQRVDRDGDTWSPMWPNPTSFAMSTMFYAPAISQAVTVLPGGDAALFGGTWDDDPDPQDEHFRGWLRGVDMASGEPQCLCIRDGVGVLALAAAADGSAYVGGFRQNGQAELWLARVPAGCPDMCAPSWEVARPGVEAYEGDDWFRPEFVQDAIYALVPLADGVLAGGVLDKQPFVTRYAADGGQPRSIPASGTVDHATVLALAVDGACVTMAGSADYPNYAERVGWVRRVHLPE